MNIIGNVWFQPIFPTALAWFIRTAGGSNELTLNQLVQLNAYSNRRCIHGVVALSPYNRRRKLLGMKLALL